MARRGEASQVVTIFWRDIPAQVNGQSGRDRHQVVLSNKFQRAIDRAKRKAQIYTADEDIAQWRRESSPCRGDAAAAADAEAARLERETTREYLGRLAYAGGFAADVDGEVGEVGRRELLALEELDDDPDRSPGVDTAAVTDQEAT
ncbi:MAG: virulence factor [Ilumatobacteraceae bacterium]|nr:virulence factor [Ilumatobacteraceae bacterium]